jgi:hypothetical protein
MDEPITLVLRRDEALVLYDWLHRFNESNDHSFDDQAEQRVLWDIEASLEPLLPEIFRSGYFDTVKAARARVRDSSE